MRPISTSILAAFFLLISVSEATTRRVPQDFAKIQLAINAAVSGDTVLVSEGTYKENLIITNKITVASLFFQDKDTSHISKTIIDGSAPSNPDSASVITIDGATDTTTVIVGFTIKGGKGNRRVTTDSPPLVYRAGLGIDVAGGGVTIRKNLITANNVSAATSVSAVVNIWDVVDPNGISFVIVEDNTISDNVLNGSPTVEGGALAIGHSCRIIRNRILRNSITGTGAAGKSTGYGAAAQIWDGTITFDGNLIANNYASAWGGAIQTNMAGGIITLVNNIIANNTAGIQGGAIWARWSTTTVLSVNNTIIGNTSPTGAGLHIQENASFKAINTILWNPAGAEISLLTGGSAVAAYSNIRGGLTGTGNINSDPLFVANDSLYHLSNSSPCIGAGISSASIGGVTLNAPLFDYFNTTRPRASGSKPDIGAVENDLSNPVNSVKELPGNPTSFGLSQNYPNPFNPSTTIRYSLPSSANVKLSVHDLLGREIVTLVNEEQSAGWKELQWNAKEVSSGIYFYKLQAGSFVETKRMMVVK